MLSGSARAYFLACGWEQTLRRKWRLGLSVRVPVLSRKSWDRTACYKTVAVGFVEAARSLGGQCLISIPELNRSMPSKELQIQV